MCMRLVQQVAACRSSFEEQLAKGVEGGMQSLREGCAHAATTANTTADDKAAVAAAGGTPFEAAAAAPASEQLMPGVAAAAASSSGTVRQASRALSSCEPRRSKTPMLADAGLDTEAGGHDQLDVVFEAAFAVDRSRFVVFDSVEDFIRIRPGKVDELGPNLSVVVSTICRRRKFCMVVSKDQLTEVLKQQLHEERRDVFCLEKYTAVAAQTASQTDWHSWLHNFNNPTVRRLAAEGELLLLTDTLQPVSPLPPNWPDELAQPDKAAMVLRDLIGCIVLVKKASNLQRLRREWPGFSAVALDTCEFVEGCQWYSGWADRGEVWVKEQPM